MTSPQQMRLGGFMYDLTTAAEVSVVKSGDFSVGVIGVYNVFLDISHL